MKNTTYKILKKLLLALVFLPLLFGGMQPVQFLEKVIAAPARTNDTVTLIFAGDIMGHSPQIKAAYNAGNQTYNYVPCFQFVEKYIAAADLAVANLEVPIAGAPFSGYPNFSSPDELLDALKSAGYDALLTANNHVIDRGSKGLERTVSQIQTRGFLYAGSYLNSAQRDSIYPLVWQKDSLKIALLNFTYGTNGQTVSAPFSVNYIDTVQIAVDLQKARRLHSDLIIACIHWGIEYKTTSNATQQKLAQWLVAQGVDLIIGGHPHVVQEADFITANDSLQVPVFYSLGNSISNQRDPNTDGGIMVKVEISAAKRKIVRVSFLPVWVYRGELGGLYHYYLIPAPDFIENPSSFPIPPADSAALMFFDQTTRKRLQNISVF